MCLDKDEFCKNLIEVLKKRTASIDIKWKRFTETANTSPTFEKKAFKYTKKHILEEFKDYTVNANESIYCNIDYGEKNSDKIIKIVIVSIEKDKNNKLKILICDSKKKKRYQEICNSLKYPELETLYKNIEFKMVKEFEILEKWIQDDLDDEEVKALEKD